MSHQCKKIQEIIGAISHVVPTVITKAFPAIEIISVLGDVLFGNKKANINDVRKAVVNNTLSNEQTILFKIKIQELQVKKLMEENEALRIEAKSQNEARKREIANKDYFPRIMTIIIISGYFTMVGCFILFPSENKEFISAVLDEVLGPCVLYATGYYYGKANLKGAGWLKIFSKKTGEGND